jgi:hypothetical protein
VSCRGTEDLVPGSSGAKLAHGLRLARLVNDLGVDNILIAG